MITKILTRLTCEFFGDAQLFLGFLISSLVSEIFGKELRPLFFPKIEPKHDFFDVLNKPLS